VTRFGVKNVYILSAGWGLICADFLTPAYDITFSPSAAPYKRRRKTDRYEDFRMLPDKAEREIVFFGGQRLPAAVLRADGHGRQCKDGIFQFCARAAV